MIEIGVVTVAITVTGTLITGYMNYKAKLKKINLEYDLKIKELEQIVLKKEKEVTELQKSFNALDTLMDFEFLNTVQSKVSAIFEETKADRFLILYAVNGKEIFNFVSCIYEQHKKSNTPNISIGAVSRYCHVEIDDNYRNMLKRSEKEGAVLMETDRMYEGVLKNFYTFEKVQHSLIKFIARLPKTEHDDIVVFCSVATHQITSFSKEDLQLIKAHVDGIRLATIKLNNNE